MPYMYYICDTIDPVGWQMLDHNMLAVTRQF